jgi:hypothetical protein
MGSVRKFATGATRDTDDGKLDYEGFLSPLVIRRYAEYMHEHRKQADGKLRDSDNWQKGIPRLQYRKSLIRHIADLWLIFREPVLFGNVQHHIEDLLCAVMFNSMGMLYEILKERDVK